MVIDDNGIEVNPLQYKNPKWVTANEQEIRKLLTPEFSGDSRYIKVINDFLTNDLSKNSQPLEKNNSKLEKFFKDRITDTKDQYKAKGEKQAGVTEGYVAKRLDDANQPFILKRSEQKKANDSQLNDNRRDNVTEYIMGGFYNRFLPKRSPVVSITKDDANPSKDIYIRSKFFQNFQTLTELTGQNGNGAINPADSKLQKIDGFEKVMAGCIIGGELDYHASNIGVLIGEGGRYEAVKIDHGRSAMYQYSNEQSLIKTLAANFKEFSYSTMPFNIEKFKEAMKDVTKISEDEISNIVQDRVYQLQKANFKVDDINFSKYIGNKKEIYITKTKKPNVRNKTPLKSLYDDLAKYFEGTLKANLAASKELVKSLEVISKIDKDPRQTDQDYQNFKDKGWLQVIGYEDPVVWARLNGRKIEGKDPKAWAEAREKLIKDENSVALALAQNIKIEGQNSIDFAVRNNIKIEGKDPIIWAVENKKAIEGKGSILWAASKGNKIEGKDPIVFALNNKKTLEGVDPIIWAVSKGEKNRSSGSD
jgi:hypothetical protein